LLEKLLPIVVPAATILISVITSVIVTTLRNKAELKKIQTELELKYSKSLFDKRMEVYPELSSILSSYSKIIQYDKHTIENLKEFSDQLDDWNNKNSLFFTSATVRISRRLRAYLNALLNHSKNGLTEEEWQGIAHVIYWFEKSLRADIGMYHAKPPGEVMDIEIVYKFIDDKLKAFPQNVFINPYKLPGKNA